MCNSKLFTYNRWPIITVVIIGAALIEVFGRMTWPALVALGILTGAFFGTPAIAKVIAQGGSQSCL